MNETKRKLLLTLSIIIIAGVIFMVQRSVCGAEGCGPVEVEEGGTTYLLASNFSGGGPWINSEPLSIEDLKGKVVLVDFWTYTCINCIRTLPYLKDWHEKYAEHGLVIIGVHTPEFSFEKEEDNVNRAVKKAGIEYPVVMDNDYHLWRAYDNHYWPHKYLVDAKGRIRYDHIGEGGYGETEAEIVKLLKEVNPDVEVGKPMPEESAAAQGQTPELYAGYRFARAPLGNPEGFKPDQVVRYAPQTSFERDRLYLEGSWVNNADNLQHADNKPGKLILSFKAKTVNIVGQPMRLTHSQVELLLDGKPMTEETRGDDVVLEDGKSYFVMDEPRLYNIVRLDGSEEKTVTFIVKDNSFSFNAFTFGS